MEYNYYEAPLYNWDEQGNIYLDTWKFRSYPTAGKYHMMEEESEGEYFEFEEMTLKQIEKFIKRLHTEAKQQERILKQEQKHDSEIARIEALMEQGMDNEAAEEMVLENGLEAILDGYEERDLDAELEQERQRIERECLEALGIAA